MVRRFVTLWIASWSRIKRNGFQNLGELCPVLGDEAFKCAGRAAAWHDSLVDQFAAHRVGFKYFSDLLRQSLYYGGRGLGRSVQPSSAHHVKALEALGLRHRRHIRQSSEPRIAGYRECFDGF